MSISKSKNQTGKNQIAETDEIYSLIEKFSGGEKDVFSQIALRYENIIKILATSFHLPSNETDDLFQEGTIALYNAVCAYDRNAHCSFQSFAELCIKRRMITYVKKYYKKKIDSISFDDFFNAKKAIDTSLFPSVEEQYMSKEDFNSLCESICLKLSPFESRVFRLYVKNMSADEMSKKLSVSKKSCQNAVVRIKNKLKK